MTKRSWRHWICWQDTSDYWVSCVHYVTSASGMHLTIFVERKFLTDGKEMLTASCSVSLDPIIALSFDWQIGWSTSHYRQRIKVAVVDIFDYDVTVLLYFDSQVAEWTVCWAQRVTCRDWAWLWCRFWTWIVHSSVSFRNNRKVIFDKTMVLFFDWHSNDKLFTQIVLQ